MTNPTGDALKTSAAQVNEDALDNAAREGYAIRCKTYGPRTLQKYASDEIMQMQLDNARVIVSAYLAALPLVEQSQAFGLVRELLQALCGELRTSRGEHQDLINRARAALSVGQAPQPVEEVHLKEGCRVKVREFPGFPAQEGAVAAVEYKIALDNADGKQVHPMGAVMLTCYREDFELTTPTPTEAPPVEQAPQPVAGEANVRVNPDQERMIRDIVGSAYDRGYTDARNASATPGDNAPGYRGQDAERAHSDELLARFNRLAAIVESPAQTEAPPVESQAAEVARLPKDTIALVVAAREVLDYLYGLDGDRVEALDRAVEAFADRVPFDDEPDAALAAEGSAE